MKFPSSPNPVGSGARATGMGGAFIAVADDATAASWNPGGLIQLDKPEISVVYAGFHREENNTFAVSLDASGNQSISDISLNYASLTYPFPKEICELWGYPMIISVSSQKLYDFSRDFRVREGSKERSFSYQLDGSLSAFGLAYSILITRNFSMGMTLNLWEDGAEKNQWEDRRSMISTGVSSGYAFTEEMHTFEQYTFRGINMNFGILWNMNEITLGAVFKTPFRADLKHDRRFEISREYPEHPESDFTYVESFSKDGTMDMPMSYGLGLAYKFSDELTAAIDIYRTEWDDFVLRDYTGRETSPITGKPSGESEIDPTHQIRIGAEYLIRKKDMTPLWWEIHEIPIRCGIFYDPAPAEGSPDDFFGLSFGSGFVITERFSFDMAYQYRFGRDVGTSILKNREFSQDIDEHTVYSSLIIYF